MRHVLLLMLFGLRQESSTLASSHRRFLDNESRNVFGWHDVNLQTNDIIIKRSSSSSASSLSFLSFKHWPTEGVVWTTLHWESIQYNPSDAQEWTKDMIVVHCHNPQESQQPLRVADIGGYIPITLLSDQNLTSIPLLQHTTLKVGYAYINGTGSARVRLVHSNCAYTFSYVRTTMMNERMIIAQSTPYILGQDTDPVGTRISFAAKISDVFFTWTSMNETSPAYVRWGLTAGGPYPNKVYAPTDTFPPLTYHPEDMCHAPSNTSGITSYLFPGWFHTIPLRDLAPNTQYYAVYGQDGGVEAPETSFTTRKPLGPDVPTRFAAFGDSATYPIFPGSVTTVDSILSLHENGFPMDFTAMIGDLGYAEGSTLVWALWTGFVWPIASRISFMVTVGNHETNTLYCFSNNSIAQQSMWQGPVPAINAYGDDSGGEGAVPTYMRYRGPANDVGNTSSSGSGVLWYSFDVGSVHFVYYSSEHDIRPGSPQNTWLVSDLTQVNRSITPWLVVAMHRPMYNGLNDSDATIGQGQTALLEPLFLQSKVDLVLSGHYHSYCRTLSLKQNATVDPTGLSPVYITVGTGGATYHSEPIRPDARTWTAYTDAEWGFGLVEAYNHSALRWTFRANECGGCVKDEAWIFR